MRRRMPRKKKDWSRAELPVGTIRVRRGKYDNKKPVRYIKVSLSALPRQRRWMLYSRWLWEKKNGPVPKGRRVAHADGDTLNDSPDNHVLLEAADVICLWHQRNPERSKRQHARAGAATATHNRERGRVIRALRLLPSKWYPVNLAARTTINFPFRTRFGLLRHYGVDTSQLPRNGHGRAVRRAIERCGFTPMRGEELSGERFAGFRKVDDVAELLRAVRHGRRDNEPA